MHWSLRRRCLGRGWPLFQPALFYSGAGALLKATEAPVAGAVKMTLAAVLTGVLCAAASAQGAQSAHSRPATKPRAEATEPLITGVSLTTSDANPPQGNTVNLTSAVATAPGVAAPTGSITFYSETDPLVFDASNASPQVSLEQGWATDGTYIYTIDTTSITKRNDDATWSSVTQNTTPFAGLTSEITHLGDGEYYNGKLYVPAEYWGGCLDYQYQTIAVYDTTSPGLPLVISGDISGDGHEASAIAVVPSENALYISSFCDGSKLWIYDLTTLTLTGTLPLSTTIDSIQGISYNAATNSLFMTADAHNSSNAQYGGEVYQVSLTGTVTPMFAVPGPGELEGLDFTQSSLGYAINESVFFLSGGPLALGTAALNAGSASLTTGSILTGTGVVTAVYSGDANYAPATSNAVAETITRLTPTIAATASSTVVSTAQTFSVAVSVAASGGGPLPSGSVILTCGTYNSMPTELSDGAATISASAWLLPVGSDTITATYLADSASTATYNSVSAAIPVAVTYTTPTVTVTPSSASMSTVQSLNVAIAVSTGSGSPNATGVVTLTSGAYSSPAIKLAGGVASLTIPAETLPAGVDALNVAYSPDAVSAPIYTSADGAGAVTVALTTPQITLGASSTDFSVTQSLTMNVALSGGSGNPKPTGSVTLTDGSYSSAITPLASGDATINIAPGSLPTGDETLTVTYRPDTASSGIYASASQTLRVIEIGSGATTITITTSARTITNEESLSASVMVAAAPGLPTLTGAVTISSGSYSAESAISSGKATFAIPAGALGSGADTLTAQYSGDPNYGESSAIAAVDVASLALSVTNTSSIFPGASATAVATFSAGNSFTGTMNLSCVLTSAPAGAQSLPGCTVNPTAITFANGGTKAVTVTMSSTAGSSTAMLRSSPRSGWPLGGGAALLAGVLLTTVPWRRRRACLWIPAFLLAAAVTEASGCGGGGSPEPVRVNTPATTTGSYVFTVTGVAADSLQTSVSATVTITVE
jgi:hypothetical protein